MTTVATMSALNTRSMVNSAPRFDMPKFAKLRASMPQMNDGSVLAQAGGIVLKAALAAVPFAAVGWLFVAF